MTEQKEPTTGRLPLLTPDKLTPIQRVIYDEISGGRRARGPFRVVDEGGHLLGPFNALLYTPAVGDAVQRLGHSLRFQGTLAPRLREIIICVVATELESEYEWYAHSRVALEAELTAEQLESIRANQTPDGLEPAELAALKMTKALLRHRRVSTRLYDQTAEILGKEQAVEVSILVGYYQLLSGLLALFAIGSPE